MKNLLLLMTLTLGVLCDANPEDLSGKMFTFPQQTNTAQVRLNITREVVKAATACLRSFTDLTRNHALFSLATPSRDNAFLIFKTVANRFSLFAQNEAIDFIGQDYELNTWQSICYTWSSDTGVGQLWVNGKPSTRKFIVSGAPIAGQIIVTLGQEQDGFGRNFDAAQSYVGMLSDVHMWDYVLSPCEIQRYMEDLNFTPGNIFNWRALDYAIKGRVLLENKQTGCGN